MNMWICDTCGNEYSAMLSDDDVPEICECGGKVREAEEPKSKKYTALAELSMAYKVEFYDSDIPKGMTADEYADQLAENGAYEECENGGDFKVYQIHEEPLYPRKCVECGEGMQEGYLGADGGTWCSDKCLFADGYTPEQYAIDYENGDCFWTNWELNKGE